MINIGFKNDLDASHSRMTIYGKGTMLNLLSEHFQSLSKKYKSDNVVQKMYIEAESTLILLIKTYDLYKDVIDIEHLPDLLKFAITHIGDGLMSGLPYVNSIDKDFNIIKEIYLYIDEIRSNYISSDIYYMNNRHNTDFMSYYFSKENVNYELYSLFTKKILKDTVLDNVINKEDEILERMLDEYEKFRDSIFYRLENVDFYMDSYITDPFTSLRMDYLGRLRFKPNEYNSITIESNQTMLELALNLSYNYEDLKIELVIVNQDNIMKRYVFKNGELISTDLSDKRKIYEIYRRLPENFHVVPSPKYVKDLIEIIEVNVSKMKVKSIVYNYNYRYHRKIKDLLGYIYDKKYSDFCIECPVLNIKSYDDFKANYSNVSTVVFLIIKYYSNLFKLNIDVIVEKVKNDKSNDKPIFKNKINGRILTKEEAFKSIFRK